MCWAIKFLPGCPAKNNFSLGWLLNKWFRRLTMVFLLTWLGTDSEFAEPRPPLTGNRSLVKLLLSFDFVLISRSSPLTSLFYEWGPDSKAWTSKTTGFFCLTPRFSIEIFKDGIKRYFYPFSHNHTLSKRAEGTNINQVPHGDSWICSMFGAFITVKVLG